MAPSSYKQFKTTINMRNLLLLLSIGMLYTAQAQDIIIKKDGSELDVKITDITEDALKYNKAGLSVSFTLNLSDVLLVTFENGERMTFDVSNKSSNSDAYVIPAGTRVPVAMTETISSDKKGGRKVTTGELVTLEVVQDVTDINGNILFAQGTQVNGRVTNAAKRKAAGTKGKLSIAVTEIKAVDGTSIPVDMKYEYTGKSKTAVAVGAAVLVAAPLLLIKGKPAIITAGTRFEALTLGDKKIKL